MLILERLFSYLDSIENGFALLIFLFLHKNKRDDEKKRNFAAVLKSD